MVGILDNLTGASNNSIKTGAGAYMVAPYAGRIRNKKRRGGFEPSPYGFGRKRGGRIRRGRGLWSTLAKFGKNIWSHGKKLWHSEAGKTIRKHVTEKYVKPKVNELINKISPEEGGRIRRGRRKRGGAEKNHYYYHYSGKKGAFHKRNRKVYRVGGAMLDVPSSGPLYTT